MQGFPSFHFTFSLFCKFSSMVFFLAGLPPPFLFQTLSLSLYLSLSLSLFVTTSFRSWFLGPFLFPVFPLGVFNHWFSCNLAFPTTRLESYSCPIAAFFPSLVLTLSLFSLTTVSSVFSTGDAYIIVRFDIQLRFTGPNDTGSPSLPEGGSKSRLFLFYSFLNSSQ